MATASGYNTTDTIEQGEESKQLRRKEYDLRHIAQLKEDLAMEQRSRQRQRQMEREDMQQRFAADADYINRKRIAIEQELECSDTDLQKLSDSDKERIKLEIYAIGKDHRMMEKREKKEQDDWMRRVEEDEVYIRRQLDSIEREERLLRREQKKEEEYLEQQRRRQLKSAYSLQQASSSTQLRGRSSSGEDNGLQTRRGAAEIADRQPNSDMRLAEKQHDIEGMTVSELQEQMHRLQREMLNRNKADSFILTEAQYQGTCDKFDKDERKEDGVRGRTGFPRSETEQYERENQLSMNLSQRQSESRDDGNTERKQVEYVTVDATEDSLNLKDSSNVNRRKGTEAQSNSKMMVTLDKEIQDMDDQLRRLKEKSFKLKRSQGLEKVELQEDKDNGLYRKQPQHEGTYVDERTMEKDIKAEMRSTPIYPMDRAIRKSDENPCKERFSEIERYPGYEQRQRECKPRIDSEIRRQPDHDRYEQEEQERSAISQAEGRNSERIAMMKLREERLMEREQALAVKEREMERKHLLLEQQLEAQRKEELEGPNEEEILLREKQLNERTQQMQAKERELEELEAAVKHRSSSTLKLQQQKDRTLLDRKGDDERDSNKLPTSKHRFISEEELKVELLKDRLMQSSTRSGRVFEEDLSSEKRPTKSIEEKDTEERISLEKNFPFPKITAFSGEENRPKGEASYEEWRYEVKCLQRDGVYSKYVIGQAIRKSLRGPAKREIIQMGPTATVEEIMERLESTFANVATGMSVMQEFFTASQKQEESVAAWALRLEEIMQNAIDKGQIKEEEKDDLLRDKFWRSLRSERLKNATRIDFRTVSNFKRLVKAVRTEELSMKTNANAQYQAVTTNVTKKEERKDGIETEKQGQVYQTLMDLRKELKIYNKKRGRGRGRQWNQNQEQNQRPGQRWNQYENQRQRNQQPGNQQQENQQQGNQQQGNQYDRDQQELQRSQTKQEPSTQQDSQQQGQQSTQRSDNTRSQALNM